MPRHAVHARRIGAEIAIAAGRLLAVRGGCMRPSVPAGADVRIVPCTPAQLRTGDTIVFERGGRLFAHRYLGVFRRDGQRWLLTKADRARRPDEPAPPEALVGRVSGFAFPSGRHTPLEPDAPGRLWAYMAGLAWWQFMRLRRAWRRHVRGR